VPPVRLPARPRLRDERGFTLSEFLLVAVFVVGLVAVALSGVRGIHDANARSDCQTELRSLKLAVERYHAHSGTYPENWGQLISSKFVERPGPNWTFEPAGADKAPDYVPVGFPRC
jgi:Tfp pilus assembly protein PilE